MNPIDSLRASGMNPIVIDEDTDFDDLPRPMTNIDFVTDLMTYNPAGSLAQAFIIEAIGKYAEAVTQAQPWGDEVMVSFDAWQACAQHIHDKIKTRY